MPSTSKKQHNFMAAVANNPAVAKKAGVPHSVGQDFTAADKGKKFGSGSRADIQLVNNPKTNQGKSELFKKGGDTMASKMDPKMMAMMMAKKKMATGGSVDVGNSTKMGKVRTEQGNTDGIAQRGKTKGKQMVMSGNKGMKMGGMAKAKK